MKLSVSVIAAFMAVLCLGYFVQAQESNGAEQSNQVKMSGVLIDQHCGMKMQNKANPQQAAEKHSKSCCLECADHGFAIMSNGKLTKISNDSKDKVSDYLKQDNSTTNVTIEGTKEANGEIKISSITPNKTGAKTQETPEQQQ